MHPIYQIAFIGIFVAACTATSPEALSSRFASMPTSALWAQQRLTQSPLELAFIEAELGARQKTSSGSAYLGKRTRPAFGNQLYARGARPSSRIDQIDDKNCDDFPSAANAQKFFLASGGPFSDPHNLDGDGDGLACEWGVSIQRISSSYLATVTSYRYSPVYQRCYVGPRGGTYTLTASGNKNYSGC